MPLDLTDCQFHGPALPEPFVKLEIEKELTRLKLLAKTTGDEGQRLKRQWEACRRSLSGLAATAGAIRVRNLLLDPLLEPLGYAQIEQAQDVHTREGMESGGWLLSSEGASSPKLRLWTTSYDEDLFAPSKRGHAYRFSHLRVAQRVLLAASERVGLLSNGTTLLLLISDPARPDSMISIPLDTGWRRSREIPDSFRFLLALARPEGVRAIPDLVDKARLQQAQVTKELRLQARRAVEGFIQGVLDHPSNREELMAHPNRQDLSKALWHEGLILVYRLLFVLKLESGDDPARSFSFASTSLWRNTFSPSMALSRFIRGRLDRGIETGGMLESGLRTLFRMFSEGLSCTELVVKPLAGGLFGTEVTPLLSRLTWGEDAVAHLLDQLLWTTPKRRGEGSARERVHYGTLDVEDLGRVYEALLELEPGIAEEPMCRLRRSKQEVVVPSAQGEKYRQDTSLAPNDDSDTEGDEAEEPDDDESSSKKTKVLWIEAIPKDRFYLRVGLGRKASGSYYTPHSFVRFLVQETLGPQVVERSPAEDPKPIEILKLKVLDPAMGSGHFLVEACRFLGEKLYEACRLCDEKALDAEHGAEKLSGPQKEECLKAALAWRKRVTDLPDPEDELLRYLPSRSPEGEESGYSQKRAEALCRRLVATHCLYGVDKNRLAVELAKLALWLESHAEGMPLTFLDHRLVVGDSLTGPFWEKLLFFPGDGKPVDGLFLEDLDRKLARGLGDALSHIQDIEASVGVSVADLEKKVRSKGLLDRSMVPFRVAAAAWAGGVMLGPELCHDHEYGELLKVIGNIGDLPATIQSEALRNMIAKGLGVQGIPEDREAIRDLITSARPVPALSFDLTFPEVFYPHMVPHGRRGFDAVLGNPPWDTVRQKSKEFYAAFDFDILNAPTKRERVEIEKRLKEDPRIDEAHERYLNGFSEIDRAHEALFRYQVVKVGGERTGGDPDLAKLFLERNEALARQEGTVGLVVPSAFHANEGATGVRQLYLEHMRLRTCYSFENRRKLFEIDSRFKFALVVAQKGGATEEVSCAFYLHDDEWLFGDRKGRDPLRYSLDFIRSTGGDYLSLLELRSQEDHEAAEVCFRNGEPFGSVCDRLCIRLQRELHMTDDAHRFTPTRNVLTEGEDPRDPDVAARLLQMGYLVLHEGKTFHQFTDHWEGSPRYLVHIQQLRDRAPISDPRFFRAAYRKFAASTNERTAIFSVHVPGVITPDQSPSECRVSERATSSMLTVVSVVNAYPFDFCLRLYVSSSTVNYFFIARTVLPRIREREKAFLVHSSLRLICNHPGYAPLWSEQVGDAWREPSSKPFKWPVLEGDDARWEVRAAIDAVVADSYGLSRQQYEHVLSTFSHSSYPKAPELCLAKFDELKKIGLEVFSRKYDPYWDIPLNESLPKPVIELPLPKQEADDQGRPFELSAEPPKRRGRKKK